MRRISKLFLIGVFIYYAICLYSYITVPIVKRTVDKIETLEVSVSGEGYIIRDESTLIHADIDDSSILPIVRQNEKAAKFGSIATAYKGSIDQKTYENLIKVNDRIAEAEKSKEMNHLFDKDLENLQTKIGEQVSEIVEASYSNRLSNLSAIKQAINRDTYKKSIISGDNSSTGYNLEALYAEQQLYEEKIKADKNDLIAPVSGVISYDIDGLEEILTPDNIPDFNVKDWKTLIDTETSGSAAAKIINDVEWYVSVLVNTAAIADVEVGNQVKVRFKDIKTDPLTGYVYFISPDSGGQSLITISCSRYIDNLYTIRKVSVDIIKESHSGFKVPSESLRMKDESVGVYVVRNSRAIFKKVNVLYKDANFAIIEQDNTAGVLLYDEIIVKSGEIEENQEIG